MPGSTTGTLKTYRTPPPPAKLAQTRQRAPRSGIVTIGGMRYWWCNRRTRLDFDGRETSLMQQGAGHGTLHPG